MDLLSELTGFSVLQQMFYIIAATYSRISCFLVLARKQESASFCKDTVERKHATRAEVGHELFLNSD